MLSSCLSLLSNEGRSHGVEVRGVRSSHVVVDDGECCSTLPLLQVVLNSTRPIEAEDDEVTGLKLLINPSFRAVRRVGSSSVMMAVCGCRGLG